MSTLKNRLKEDMTSAMKGKDAFTLSTLRLVLGEIQTVEKSGKTPKDFNDAETEAFIAKQVKTRRDSAQTYADAGAVERAERETAEADLLGAYLPKPLTEEVVVAFVDAAIAVLENPTPKSMGLVMKVVNAEVKGRFDGKRLSELVRERLV